MTYLSPLPCGRPNRYRETVCSISYLFRACRGARCSDCQRRLGNGGRAVAALVRLVEVAALLFAAVAIRCVLLSGRQADRRLLFVRDRLGGIHFHTLPRLHVGVVLLLPDLPVLRAFTEAWRLRELPNCRKNRLSWWRVRGAYPPQIAEAFGLSLVVPL